VILTVTLNAAIDRTVAVPSFRQGHRHRAVEASTVAGGKGINVARALKLLDRPVIATGLAGGPTGARLMERLAEESILTDFTWIAGESRTNLAVIDPTSGEQTEINERGPDVSAEELERFLQKLLYLARGARICVIAGSLPPSVPAAFAARMITELKQLGVETIVDVDGEPLTFGDGLLLLGRTLFVVRNRENLVAVVRLDGTGSRGTVVDEITSDDFDVPTTVALFAGGLYLPNARFTTEEPTEFWVTRIDLSRDLFR
jgi:1-phosphofructokinase family hexose kinase